MQSELQDGCGAYQLVDARMASNANGLSFGAVQWDMAQRSDARALFNQALDAAEAEAPTLNQEDRAFLNTVIEKTTYSLRGQAETWARLCSLESAVDAALASPAARAVIDDAAIAELQAKLDTYQTWMRGIETDENRTAIEENLLLKVLVLDYGNILGSPNLFRRALNGESICPHACANFGEPEIVIAGAPGAADVLRVLMATKYGHYEEKTRRWDALRRVDNVIDAVGAENIMLSQTDRAYLAGDFATIVDGSVALSGKSYPHIAALIAAASAAP